MQNGDAGASVREHLNAIVAVCADWGIGHEGALLVRNKADMRSFVAHTTGRTVLMGRATLDSFPGGRALANRRNVVLTRDAAFARENVEVAHSVEEALAMVAGDPEVWVIGGEQVYRQLLPQCARAIVTKHACTRPADAFFPDLDADPAWRVTEESDEAQTPEGVSYRFVTYERA